MSQPHKAKHKGRVAILDTDRLLLRQLTLEDAAFILRLVNDADWLRHIGDKNVHSLEYAQAYLRNGPLAMYEKFGHGLWLVLRKTDAAPMGMCGLIKRDSLPDVDIGFAYLPEFRSQGYAREAAAATLLYAQQQLGLRRVVAITSPANLASIRLLEKIGLRNEGSVQMGMETLSLFAWGETRIAS